MRLEDGAVHTGSLGGAVYTRRGAGRVYQGGGYLSSQHTREALFPAGFPLFSQRLENWPTVRFNVVNARYWALGGTIDTRFTVGRHCWHAGDERLMSVMCPSMGPGPVPLIFPFHCWSMLRTSRNIKNVTEIAQPWGYTGGTCQPAHHPFHCWAMKVCKSVNHFLS